MGKGLEEGGVGRKMKARKGETKRGVTRGRDRVSRAKEETEIWNEDRVLCLWKTALAKLTYRYMCHSTLLNPRDGQEFSGKLTLHYRSVYTTLCCSAADVLLLLGWFVSFVCSRDAKAMDYMHENTMIVSHKVVLQSALKFTCKWAAISRNNGVWEGWLSRSINVSALFLNMICSLIKNVPGPLSVVSHYTQSSLATGVKKPVPHSIVVPHTGSGDEAISHNKAQFGERRVLIFFSATDLI